MQKQRQPRKRQKKKFRDLAIEIHKLEGKIEEDKNEIIEILNMRASTKGKMSVMMP